MEYLDFSSVITLIRNDARTVANDGLKDEVRVDQVKLMELVFAIFNNDESA